MRKEVEGSKEAGTFYLPSGQEIYGELNLAGKNTSLYLHSKEDLVTIQEMSGGVITGVLLDRTRVSLIQCITLHTTSHMNLKEKYYSAHIFPHYVIHGDHHISPNKKEIAEAHFLINDATTLFYDYGVFGQLLSANSLVKKIVNKKKKNSAKRKIKVGKNAFITYFTGKEDIFKAKTIWGTVRATHKPTFGFPNPEGIRVKNHIFVTISFRKPVSFDKAISQVNKLVNYFSLLVGRPQKTENLSLSIKTPKTEKSFLSVYQCASLKEEVPSGERNPHPSDVLLEASRYPENFSKVLESWIGRYELWDDSRARFFGCFRKQHRYDYDRVIAAANMFDILPNSAAPQKVHLAQDLENARESARSIFKHLPTSIERDSILNALGRLGTSTLKHKIRYRAQIVLDKAGPYFLDLYLVTDCAVNCRNHYVHGSVSDFNYNENFNAVMFFTDTLEFIFAASDMIEAGWDIEAWIKKGTTQSHPFGAYRVNYPLRLENLKSLLKNS